MRDPYAVLGVAKDASAADIRKAYKKLARKHHPDVAEAQSDGDAFQEINAAYDILGDDDKRKLYDEFGEASTRPRYRRRASTRLATTGLWWRRARHGWRAGRRSLVHGGPRLLGWIRRRIRRRSR